MKIAVVYNRDSQDVINIFGRPNQEKIGLKVIHAIVDGLKGHGHQAISFEGDKSLVERLETFMPRVVKGERPGMVFNLSYGIQGQSRYTHVPSILEMVGIPYVASGPLAHSIALDKVVTKMILVQHGLPTPPFAVLQEPGFEDPQLPYPLIVKPRNEAVSFGIRVVNDLDELREAAGVIFDKFGQTVLAEAFVEGREVNVGLLGNAPPQALPPVELDFGGSGQTVYSYEDKTGRSGRTIGLVCPATIGPEMTERVQELARKAFLAIGCCDCARVDFRIDAVGNPYILELNSLPAMGPRGSYVRAAKEVGLEFPDLVNRLVEVASARYFGTPAPPEIAPHSEDTPSLMASFITQRRDRLERRVAEWTRRSSRTGDPVGLQVVGQHLGRTLTELGMAPIEELTDERHALTWATPAGLDDGTLLVLHLDVPALSEVPNAVFRHDPEWLFGEGVGLSRAPLVVAEYALRALRHVRQLRKRRIGLVAYLDEGSDARYSADILKRAMQRASQVLVLRPGGEDGHVYRQRRGQRRYRLRVEGKPRSPGRGSRSSDVLPWIAKRVQDLSELSEPKKRVTLSMTSLQTESFRMLLPHRVDATLLLTYLDTSAADRIVENARKVLGRGGPRWELELVADRPPREDSKSSRQLLDALGAAAARWEVPLEGQTSAWPSVAGLAPEKSAVLCGLGPEARDLYTPHEAVRRITLVQRTLMLAQYLLDSAP
ncbi:MAG: ATP-grasp domain-containing protein [Planctomycetota bacterium]|jgi:D-alanine-D-alanine ligase